jgi:DNA polymerase gamma 1
MDRIVPLLLQYTCDGQPLRHDKEEGWHTMVSPKRIPIELVKGKKTRRILSKAAVKYFNNGKFTSCNPELARALCCGEKGDDVREQIMALGSRALKATSLEWHSDPWLSQLDWALLSPEEGSTSKTKRSKKPKPLKPPPVLWPKWYWDATAPKKDLSPGTLQVTVRTRVAPLLLRLSWFGHPLFHSREHGWTFRVPANSNFQTRTKPVKFYDPTDSVLSEAVLSGGYNFYKLPHKDGEEANVGNPLGKTFVKYVQDGTLRSPGNEATEALDLNSLCSYWISARDRILNQLVVWQKSDRSLGLPNPPSRREKYGIILPQVIPMGTVTRRAIEKTWLTASNAKKNRVGSELKAMVRAPEGYAIVGADVDSEELWISSCMGDAQFGLHGASAIGWMTLEGTKSAGTDLHSKTANILGISRDQAKVFNYSRIYGAGMRHAVLLLLQSNPSMRAEEAQKLAENLYASTKGKNTHRTDLFDRKFWYGGTESFLFNKLEEIALSDRPQTPALGCGVTYALSKEFLPEGFGTDYLPSRINWVVQSSGVDYLHMLIVSMTYLIKKYDIQARYLISVHDELRYLVVEEDKYRAALALQIANLWTRCMFAFKLGMDDLPQGVAFFSAVDIDRVLRKEVDMPCVTPSQPIPIPSGESLDILTLLEKTQGGTLRKDGLPMREEPSQHNELIPKGYEQSDCLAHRAKSAAWLKAQASTDFGEVKGLAEHISGKKYADKVANKKKSSRRKPPLGNGDGFDWNATIERLLAS